MALRGLKMKSTTVTHKQIRVAKFNGNLARALAEHDLVLGDKNKIKQNRITEKSDMNVYTFRGQEIKTEEERKEVLNYIESLYENDNKEFDLTKFSKTKSKFKRWIDNDKTPEEEKSLYRKLLKYADERQNQSISTQKAINMLLNTGGKVSRLNDKKKAIQALSELHNQKINMNIDSESQLNIRVIPMIFKIPHHNQTTLTGEEQEELLNGYYKDNFSDYEIIYSVVHNDEIDPHPHMMLNGKNQKTNKYDFAQNQYEYILNKIELTGFPGNYSKCSDKQIKLFGELIQQDFYDYINSKVENKNIIFEKKKYESEEEKALEREVIKTDTSKPIADRAYNTATYLEERKNKKANENNKLKKENTGLKLENTALKMEKKGLLKSIEKLVKSTIDYAAEYATTSYKNALENYKKHFKSLNDINTFIAKKTKNEAMAMQPTEEQKEEIDKASKPPKI
jgi:hypothetical protein